jgi:flavin reductase (DIM6/NTAB) family NADH-FMN oxidoreductase RutF
MLMDRQEARNVLSHFPYGIFVVGSREGGLPQVMIATWITQVSFFPQMVAMALETDSKMAHAVRESGFFSLNLLPENGKEIASSFLKTPGVTATSIGGHDYAEALNGSPFLLEANASLECRVVHRMMTGDHELVVGEVVDARAKREGEVLTMRATGWNYQR